MAGSNVAAFLNGTETRRTSARHQVQQGRRVDQALSQVVEHGQEIRQPDRSSEVLGRARPYAHRRVSASPKPLSVCPPFLSGAASEREGAHGEPGRLCTPELHGTGAEDRRPGSLQSRASRSLPRRPPASAPRQADDQPWPRLWQNIRATRATELADQYPSHVAAAWLGHTERIADRHYRQTTGTHYDRAINEPTGPMPGQQEDLGLVQICAFGGTNAEGVVTNGIDQSTTRKKPGLTS